MACFAGLLQPGLAAREAVATQVEQRVVQATRKHVLKVEQDLAATKLELAEVVIDKETIERNLSLQIDELRDEVQAQRKQFNEVLSSTGNVMKQQVLEVRTALSQSSESTMHEFWTLRQLLDKTDKGLQSVMEKEPQRERAFSHLDNRLEENRQQMMDYFKKIDGVLHDEHSGVIPRVEGLRRARHALEQQVGDLRTSLERVQKEVEDASGRTSRFQEHNWSSELNVSSAALKQRPALFEADTQRLGANAPQSSEDTAHGREYEPAVQHVVGTSDTSSIEKDADYERARINARARAWVDQICPMEHIDSD